MLDKIQELKNQGLSPAKIAASLNSQGLKTARGKDWAEHSVSYQLSNARGKKTTNNGPKLAKTTATRTTTAAAAPAVKRAAGSKAAARRTQPTAPVAQGFVKTSLTLGRRIDLAKEVLGSNDMDPAMRIHIASSILNA